ncbi:MAG: 4Fe-4S binding protein [Eubacteriales bacterium]|nr:4Fe-4S binding protein [Eubacteriales bacterium]
MAVLERDIIHIDEEKCDGCGLCISGCHEGALALVNGKAKLVSEAYCDGLGACLPACPTGAITVEKRRAEEFTMPAPGSPADLEMKQESAQKSFSQATAPVFSGCPGSQARSLKREETPVQPTQSANIAQPAENTVSELRQWPCQLKLLPVQAPYYHNARLLIAADCAAFARANFHQEFIKGHITAIGCPKLDSGNYAEKLAQILSLNEIKSVSIVRMEVPCCGGLEMAVKQALQASGKMIPWQVVTISTDGTILED